MEVFHGGLIQGGGYIVESLKANSKKVFPINFYLILKDESVFIVSIITIIILAMLFIVWWRNKNKISAIKVGGAIFAVTISPYIYYAIMPFHTFVHNYVEYRYQCITIMGLVLMYMLAIGKSKLSINKKRLAIYCQYKIIFFVIYIFFTLFKNMRGVKNFVFFRWGREDKMNMINKSVKKELLYSLVYAVFIMGYNIYASTCFFNEAVLFTNAYWGYIAILFSANILFAYCIIRIVKGIKTKSLFISRFIKYFLFIFMLYMGFLLLTWPGIWRWDEFIILDNAKIFYLNPYQNYIMSIFYILALMILPFPTGVIIIQIFLCSVLSGLICAMAVELFNLNSKYKMLLVVPFILFPSISSVLYPIRSSIYAYLELYIYIYIYYTFIRKKEWSVANIIIGAIVVALLSALRSETIYYIILLPLITIFFSDRKEYIKQKCIFMLLTIIIGGLLIAGQKNIEKKYLGDRYLIISTLNYLEDLNNNDFLEEEDKEVINKVLSLDVLDEFGVGAVWNDELNLINLYQKEDFTQFKLKYVELCLTHFHRFINLQGKIALNANGMGGKYTSPFIEKSYNLYSADFLDSSKGDTIKNVFLSERYTMPFDILLREYVIKVLQCVHIDRSENNFLFIILYNSFLPLLGSLVILCITKIESKVYFLAVTSILIIKTLLIIAAAPGGVFMYYFSTWMCSLFIVIIGATGIRKTVQ